METVERLPDRAPAELTFGSPKSVPMPKASLARRWVAGMVDQIILGLLNFVIAAIGDLVQSGVWELLWTLLALLVPVLYYVRAYSTTGQTVGKRIFEVRVVSADGTPLNWRHGVLRYFGYTVSALPFGLGYLWAIWDKDKQAWHDKIAGTVVIDDREEAKVAYGHVLTFEPVLDPEVARRRQRRWLIVFGVVIAVVIAVVLVAGAAFAIPMIQGGVAEVQAMEPWPEPQYQPTVVVPPDLSHLGLDEATIVAARGSDTLWGEGGYDSGAVAKYTADGRLAVWVAALRYEDAQAASEEYESMKAWAEATCGQWVYAGWGNTGLIQCRFTDAYKRTYFRDNWIIDVIVLEAAPGPPKEFIDEVRDAIVEHWETMD